jgi:hypothetical protein
VEQRADDQQRKMLNKTVHQTTERLSGTTISTGPGGLPVGTVRATNGKFVPYVLNENAVLSTLGATIRFNVVSPEDGSPIPINKEKVTRTY